jgi:dTMP kinase
MFVVVDGIDGCGKGTIVTALAEERRRRGARVLDIRSFAQEHHRLPRPEELHDFDVLISAEPTHAGVGHVIRDELVRSHDRTYSAQSTADAFALDRLVLYRRVLEPARQRGMTIFQERGVTSSIAYQPIQREPISLEDVISLEGNAHALATPPDVCIILSVEPARAVQRLQLRSEKQDNAIFEKLDTLTKLHERYQSSWFRRLLETHGWNLRIVDANGAVEDAVSFALEASNRYAQPQL